MLVELDPKLPVLPHSITKRIGELFGQLFDQFSVELAQTVQNKCEILWVQLAQNIIIGPSWLREADPAQVAWACKHEKSP